jgi:hypothetical protein
MPIRFLNARCILDYKARSEFEQEHGRVEFPHIVVGPEPRLEMRNGKGEHLALFYLEDTTKYVDQVVAVETSTGVRIMSDVWADITWAIIYDPTRENGHYFRHIQTASSECQGHWERNIATVDASEEIQDIYRCHKLGNEFRQRLDTEDARQWRLMADRACVERDRWVRVVSGRKVEIGTEGIVFWVGDSPWGRKVGVALPQPDGTFRKEKRVGTGGRTYDSYADIAWTYVKNLEVISGPRGYSYTAQVR